MTKVQPSTSPNISTSANFQVEKSAKLASSQVHKSSQANVGDNPPLKTMDVAVKPQTSYIPIHTLAINQADIATAKLDKLCALAKVLAPERLFTSAGRKDAINDLANFNATIDPDNLGADAIDLRTNVLIGTILKCLVALEQQAAGQLSLDTVEASSSSDLLIASLKGLQNVIVQMKNSYQDQLEGNFSEIVSASVSLGVGAASSTMGCFAAAKRWQIARTRGRNKDITAASANAEENLAKSVEKLETPLPLKKLLGDCKNPNTMQVHAMILDKNIPIATIRNNQKQIKEKLILLQNKDTDLDDIAVRLHNAQHQQGVDQASVQRIESEQTTAVNERDKLVREIKIYAEQIAQEMRQLDPPHNPANPELLDFYVAERGAQARPAGGLQPQQNLSARSLTQKTLENELNFNEYKKLDELVDAACNAHVKNSLIKAADKGDTSNALFENENFQKLLSKQDRAQLVANKGNLTNTQKKTFLEKALKTIENPTKHIRTHKTELQAQNADLAELKTAIEERITALKSSTVDAYIEAGFNALGGHKAIQIFKNPQPNNPVPAQPPIALPQAGRYEEMTDVEWKALPPNEQKTIMENTVIAHYAGTQANEVHPIFETQPAQPPQPPAVAIILTGNANFGTATTTVIPDGAKRFILKDGAVETFLPLDQTEHKKMMSDVNKCTQAYHAAKANLFDRQAVLMRPESLDMLTQISMDLNNLNSSITTLINGLNQIKSLTGREDEGLAQQYSTAIGDEVQTAQDAQQKLSQVTGQVLTAYFQMLEAFEQLLSEAIPH